ncbi:MAG: hypothetical protein QOK43_1847 [Acidimicrobiaceae bacterium]|nr:hypothetical protein [Acidimicrobiaceae bacterium]
MLAVVCVLAVCAVLVRDVGAVAIATWQAMQSAEGAADAAVQAVDERHYTATGDLRLDPERARALAVASLQSDESLRAIGVDGARARVTVARRPRTILIPVETVEASEASTLERGVTEAER